MVYAFYYCKKNGEDQAKKMVVVGALHEKGLLKVLKESAFALLSPVIILGCIYTGIASPTEAAVISVFYALLISMAVYKTIKVKDIWAILVESIRTYAPILFILAAAIAFSRVLTLMQVPQAISSWILSHFTNPILLLLVINAFLLIVGMVMDTTPAILILTPILLPIVESIGMESDSLWCDDGRESGDRFRNTADRRQSVCCQLAHGCAAHGDRKTRASHDPVFPCGAACYHLCSCSQPGVAVTEDSFGRRQL